MLNNIKRIIKNQKGAINTIEILGWIAVASIVLFAVVTALKPSIVGSNSILTDSTGRISDLKDIMTP